MHSCTGYNTYRDICNVGTGRAKSFDDFSDVMRTSDVEKLKQHYSHYNDVDLFVGGLLERPLNDSFLGPTFVCIIGDTFARLLDLCLRHLPFFFIFLKLLLLPGFAMETASSTTWVWTQWSG